MHVLFHVGLIIERNFTNVLLIRNFQRLVIGENERISADTDTRTYN